MILGGQLRLLRKWLWLLLALPVAAGLAAAVASALLPPVYEGEVSILVKPAQPISSLEQGGAYTVTTDQVSRTYAQLLTSRPLLEQVIADLRLATTPEELGQRVRVTPQSNTTLLKVAVQSTDRQLARETANKLVEDFIARTNRIQQQQIDQYTSRVEAQINQVRAAIQKEQTRIDQLQGQAAGGKPLPAEQQAELTSLQQQLTADRSQYFDIVRSKSEIEVALARTSDNVLVIAPAVTPARAVSPRPVLNVALAVALGLIVALGLAFLFDLLNQTVQGPEDLEQRLGLVTLAQIPHTATGKEARESLVTLKPNPALAEPYKTLRTNLVYSAVDRPMSTLVITSAGPGEGKSRTAANLAVVLAATGQRTLLIDADFRRPSQHRLFGRIRNAGLTNLILGEQPERDLIHAVDAVPQLWVLTSGPTPPNPSELLGSARMRELLDRMRQGFGYIVIDTPPVNAVTDALVLSRSADATVLVVEQGRSTYPNVAAAKQALERVGARLLGAALNKVKDSSTAYYYEYGTGRQVSGGPVKVDSS